MFYVSRLSGKVFTLVKDMGNFLLVRDVSSGTVRGYSRNVLVRVGG